MRYRKDLTRYRDADTNESDVGGEVEIYQQPPMFNEDLAPDEKSNDFYLYSNITTESLLKIRKQITKKIYTYKKVILDNNLDNNILKHFYINLHINSGGGYILDSFGMYDFLRSSPVPIHTYVEGVCASAATIISVAGSKRFMSRSSVFMIHQLSTWFGGKHDEFVDEKINLDLTMNRIKKIYLETTKMNKDKMNRLLKRDLFLEVDKCIEYGFIDYVV